MAKKKQGKKHKFKYSDPVMSSPGGIQSAATAGEVRAPHIRQSVSGATRDFSYVSDDLRRILVLAVLLILVEVSLYYAINHTGLGSTLNGMVKI